MKIIPVVSSESYLSERTVLDSLYEYTNMEIYIIFLAQYLK